MKKFQQFKSLAEAESYLIDQGWRIRRGHARDDIWVHWDRPMERRMIAKSGEYPETVWTIIAP